jgi:hypothetical protein
MDGNGYHVKKESQAQKLKYCIFLLICWMWPKNFAWLKKGGDHLRDKSEGGEWERRGWIEQSRTEYNRVEVYYIYIIYIG